MLRAGRISAGEQAPAADVMQPGPTTVRAHEDLDATRQRMNEHHVAHLLVTTPDGTLIGVVDAADS
jgi:CBS domain-containing protein